LSSTQCGYPACDSTPRPPKSSQIQRIWDNSESTTRETDGVEVIKLGHAESGYEGHCLSRTITREIPCARFLFSETPLRRSPPPSSPSGTRLQIVPFPDASPL